MSQTDILHYFYSEFEKGKVEYLTCKDIHAKVKTCSNMRVTRRQVHDLFQYGFLEMDWLTIFEMMYKGKNLPRRYKLNVERIEEIMRKIDRMNKKPSLSEFPIKEVSYIPKTFGGKEQKFQEGGLYYEY